MNSSDKPLPPRLAGRVGHDAANDSTGPALPGGETGRHAAPASAGWDPLEIWRTRVRDPRRKAPGPATP